MSVELIYDPDCPNADSAREHLNQALTLADRPPEWTEWNREDPEAPDYIHRYGSPTILVDGEDVSGVSEDADANNCRIYEAEEGGFQGVPSIETISSALHQNSSNPKSSAVSWIGGLASFPAFGVTLLPALSCSLCWPAYAGLLGAVGLGFVDYTPYVTPGIVGLLTLSILGLAYQARRRRGGFKPLVVGLVAAAVILVGRYLADDAIFTGAGFAFLYGASVWNIWPDRKANRQTCQVCETKRPK